MNNTSYDGRHKDIDLAKFAAPFSNMSESEAVALVADTFGLYGTVKRFATEKDDTFRFETSDHQVFVLKVANPGEDTMEIDLQVSLLQHVERVDISIPVPRVVPNLREQSYFGAMDQAGQFRQVRMMSFLEGVPLDSTSSSAAQREKVGEVLARLRLATADFTHSASKRMVAWNIKNLPALAYLIEEVGDPKQRRALSQGLARFAAIESRLLQLRTQVLHNDFSKSNIVVDHGNSKFVKGIIDFGDAVHTAVAVDVSTALLNQLPRNSGHLPDDDPFRDGRDLLRGYLRFAELTNEELRLMPHLVMGRVITRALLSMGLANRFPANKTYLLRNTEQGWAQLDWFLQRSPDNLSEQFLAAARS